MLLAAFLFNVLAYHFIFPFLLDSYKERFVKGKKEKMVTHIITISPSNASKINFVHSKEFFYEGRLFDILDKKVENGTTVYYCYLDKEEENAAKNHKENEKRKNAVNVSGLSNYLPVKSIEVSTYTSESLNEFFYSNSLYLSYTKEIPAPPPNV